MEDRVTDLPFKVGDSSIVIVKGLPAIQCPRCNEYLLADAVMAHAPVALPFCPLDSGGLIRVSRPCEVWGCFGAAAHWPDRSWPAD